ncbi:alpha/beta fold hydrolase [Scleromatobacter humisilvae]|uniref:Alpha/beta hydrolase n=1 Tax=Scleromatobacter humisilvae TaxID=2897159 RepID=A0A9X1YLE2_9BURK|nr:alpha/beta hydrolase [Scleromatobacter humisilvae]MCK9688106.1 alpha/beta hydrolase [Scleromatobacter humisilvae]
MPSLFRTVLAATALVALLAGCDSMGPSLKDSAYAMERSRAGLVRKEISLPDGTHVVYLEGGSGAPLVLVHGFGADKDNFTRVARYLTPHYRVIVPDLVGFGESSHRTDIDYHYAAQAQRLHDFTQALGLSRFDLGGNSMGGGISMSLAAQHPQEVASLWLLDCAGIAAAPPSELAKIVTTTDTNPLFITRESDFPAFLKFVMSDPPYIPGSVMNVMARERMANQPLERQVFAQIATDSVDASVKGLATPTLIVWGDEDRALSVGTVPVLKTLLPNAQAVVMPHVGHAPMIERPQLAAEDYLHFRGQLATR